jgi:hypothetical protein
MTGEEVSQPGSEIAGAGQQRHQERGGTQTKPEIERCGVYALLKLRGVRHDAGGGGV